MKWVVLSIGLALILPASGWLRQNPEQRLRLWTLLGFLPFVVGYLHLYMAAFSEADWGGYVKGFELSGLDLLCFAFYLSLPKTRDSLPFRYVMFVYFVSALISSAQALAPVQSLFYPWQLARMFLVFATVAKASSLDYRVTYALLKGMAIALVLEALMALWQRFGLGLTQTGGTLGHQNLLGLMAHLIILPCFALLLSSARGRLPLIVTLIGLLVELSTASRAAIGLSATGLFVIFVLSAVRKWTSRKGRILVIGSAAMLVLAPLAFVALQHRFEAVPLGDESYSERDAYKLAAEMMLSDHPFGIGANQFAVIGNVGKYYDRAGVGAYTLGRSGNVHNIYYLVAAEMGYLGLITLLLLLSAPLITAFRCGWTNVGDERGDLLLGLGVALAAVYIHSWEEWSLATFSAEYLLAISMGLVAGNAQQLGYWRSARAVESSSGFGERRPVKRTSRNVVEPAAKSIFKS